MALPKRSRYLYVWISFALLQYYGQSKKINSKQSVKNSKPLKQTSNSLTSISDNGSSPFANIFPITERKQGTKLTGTGSRRNKSVFMKKNAKRKKNKKKKLRVTSNVYAKVSTDGTLLFYFPHEINHNQSTTRRNLIVSFAAEMNDEQQNGNGSFLVAKFVPDEEKIFDIKAIDEWVPLDGIFGIYQLPSGPHLVLIVDSDEVYRSPTPRDHPTNDPLLQIRRIKSMEIIPLKLLGKDGQRIHKKDNEEEQRQFQLLRNSLKEHDFYFLSPSKDSVMSGRNHTVVTDITHTLQRSFMFWKDKQLESTFESDTINRDSKDILNEDEDVDQENITHESNTTEHENDESDAINTDDQKPESWWWSLLNQGNKYQRPDSRFFWNEFATKPLLKAFHQSESSEAYTKLLDCTIPVTSAFIGVQKNISIFPNSTDADKNVQYDQLLISRRSKYRAGTRFTKRGADAAGDVANFVETEQILIHGDTKNDYALKEIYAHVQTRGSIPIRWSSPTDIKTYRPKVMIGTDPLAQARALRNHLFEQLTLYTGIDTNERVKLEFVNLIDKHSDQGRLGRTFAAVLDAVLSVYNGSNKSQNTHLIKPGNIRHTWFDFHAECKSGRWDRLNNLLKETRPTLDDQRYFCVVPDGSTWNIISTQDGIVRTNCMDCLDRTNVVQSMFGRYIIYKHFNDRLGLDSTAPSRRFLPLDMTVAFKRNMMALPWKEGEENHRLLWADNADAISRLYAGTPALKGDFTRTGKRTRRGALDDGINSLQRFYLNNFIDADRQGGVDLLTGYSIFDTADTKSDFPKRDDISVNELHSPLKMRYLKRIMEQKKLQKELELDSRLSLYWLPGDLQSHLRSAAALSAIKVEAAQFNEDISQISLSSALRDIDRRSKTDDPWWVVFDSESDPESTVDKLVPMNKPTGGHLLGAIVAVMKAPLATAITCISIMLLGMGKYSYDYDG